MYYLWNLVMPCITLLCVGMFAHILPANGERLNVSMTTLLAFLVFLLMVPGILPPQGDVLSSIALFFGMSSVLLAFSTATTFVTIFILNQGELGVALKPWQRFLSKAFGFFFLSRWLDFIGRFRAAEEPTVAASGQRVREFDPSGTQTFDPKASNVQLEWKAFEEGFDRFCWVLFVLGCLANMIIFFIV